MRSELNITSVVKRIQDKADNNEVQDLMQHFEDRVKQMESSFIQVIEEVEQLNKQNLINQHTMT
jgi:MinD-like ATPase involved in chromosome partitioning or flagellar assembly